MAQITVKMKRLVFFCLLALVIGLVIGKFLPEREIKEKSKHSDECIPIPEVVSYPMPEGPLSSVREITTVLPLSPWEVEAILDESLQLIDLFAAITRNENKEIWVRAWREGSSNFEFFIYDVNSENWRSISAEIEISGYSADISQLFFTTDGSVYGKLYQSFSDLIDEESSPILSVFNEDLKRFVIIEAINDLPITADEANDSQILYDEKANGFWFLISGIEIYFFDIAAQKVIKKAEIHSEESTLHINAAISQEKLIYILIENGLNLTNSNVSLYSFDTQTSEVKYQGFGLETIPKVWYLFAAQSGAIWFGGVGWAEPSDEWFKWHQLVQNPLFYTNIRFSGLDQPWNSPMIEVESKDGRLWMRPSSYEYGDGMAWFDPEEERWCWFTTAISDIEKDEAGNLWLVADGKLYRYPFED